MSEQPDQQRSSPARDAPAHEPLAYMPPRQDQARLTEERLRRIAGGICSALSVFALVFVFIICQIPGSMPGSGSGSGPALAVGAPIACAAIVLAVIGGIGWYQWRRNGSRAFLAGALVGVGVAALIEGACFLVLTRR